VSVNVTYSSGQAATLSQTVVTDGNGAFSASIFVPAAVRLGNYTVAARDVARGFHATASLNVSVKPTINLDPSTIYPGQSVKVSGTNFGTGAVVHISASVHTSNGTQRLTARAVTGADGSYSATLHIPGNARAGNVVVSARTVNASVQSTLHVHLRPTPAPTAVPTNTPTPLPAPTATPTPKPHHSHALGYRYISIWYHWMRQGTREHVIVQSTISAKQGLWVHVWYPGGQHQAWYEQTDSFGHWEKWFTVPYNSATPRNQRALITFRLWHGKDNVKNFQHFGIVR
jgi:hypothetical protein